MIDYKKWLLYISIAAAVVMILTSCATTKDNKAVLRVTANNELLNKVGRVWEKSNPCVIDTIVKFQNGIETIKYDTLFNDVVKVYYDTATKTNTVTEYKTIIKTVNKTDTIVIDKTDVRRLNWALQDNTVLQTKNEQLTSNYQAINTKLRNRNLEFYGLVLLISILIILKFYIK